MLPERRGTCRWEPGGTWPWRCGDPEVPRTTHWNRQEHQGAGNCQCRSRPKDWADGQAGMSSILSKLTVSPTRRKPVVRAERKQRTAGRNQRRNRRPGRRSRCRHPGERGLCGGTGLNDGWVGRQGEEDRTEGITLLHSFGAGDDLQGRVARAGEQSALTTITAVDRRREGRKMDAHGPQDCCSVNRVESIGHIHRDGNLACVRTVAGEPLPSSVNDGFTAIGRLDPQLPKISRARSVIKSTATLLVRRRMVSPVAICLRVPLGLRRVMIEPPQTYGELRGLTTLALLNVMHL